MCSASWQFYEVAFYMAFTAIKAVSNIYGHEQSYNTYLRIFPANSETQPFEIIDGFSPSSRKR